MARITQECVARIKDSADIVELLSKYLQLRRAGNSWKACCPFHSEKTPSFHVNSARQTFHCFGCGVGGDALKFIMMFENLDYPTALRRLADMNGIPVIEEEENPEMARLRRLRSRVVEANTLATEYYHRKLCRDAAAAHVREYLKQRGFGIEIARAWQLGWAPPDFREFDQLARSRSMDDRLLAEAYLLGRGQRGLYPVFRDRLMFPIHNVRGEVVGFSGRVIRADQDPRKYVNTADTAAFHKGELLFGLYKATGPIGKAGMCVVVCEGQLDVIACHEKADIRNAVAGLGTAFTDEHAMILRKYAKKAILCYDGDNAGIKASEKTFRKLAAAGLEVYHASLPPGEDPDSLIGSKGPEALREAIDTARPYLEVRVGQELALIQGDANARAALIPRMADLAAEITDRSRARVGTRRGGRVCRCSPAGGTPPHHPHHPAQRHPRHHFPGCRERRSAVPAARAHRGTARAHPLAFRRCCAAAFHGAPARPRQRGSLAGLHRQSSPRAGCRPAQHGAPPHRHPRCARHRGIHLFECRPGSHQGPRGSAPLTGKYPRNLLAGRRPPHGGDDRAPEAHQRRRVKNMKLARLYGLRKLNMSEPGTLVPKT